MSSLDHFLNKSEPAHVPQRDPEDELQDAITTLALHHRLLTDEQVQTIRSLLPDTEEFDSEFDVKDEVTQQIRVIRALRASLMTPGGKLRSDISAKDMKEIIGPSTTLLNTLMKYQEKIISHDRQMAMERAVVEAMEGMSEEVKERFFSKLDELLESIN